MPPLSPALLAAAALLAGAAGCAHAPPTPPADPGELRVTCRGEAVQAWLLGSFNGWERPGVPLARSGAVFVGRVRPEPGVVQAACLLRTASGEETLEPPLDAPQRADDGFGGTNGVYVIAPRSNEPARNLAADRSSLQ